MVLYRGLKLTIHVIKSQIHLERQVPFKKRQMQAVTCDHAAVVDHNVARGAVALVTAHRVDTELAARAPRRALVHIHARVPVTYTEKTRN
jgi:hypothetical protein